MAYTIIRSDGSQLTTIADGTINTTSTSLALPGRNYAGYGQSIDTNFVRQLENYANSSPPPNPLRGQLWFNTGSNVLCVCPADGETSASNWLTLSATGSGGTTTFGNVTITGNLNAGNGTFSGSLSADTATFRIVNVTANLTASLANITTGNIGTTRTTVITTGATTTSGTLTGNWTVNNDLNVTSNVKPNAIYTDNYFYANGVTFNPSGTYSNANVASYLPTYTGNIGAWQLTANVITTGSNVTPGTLTGNWTLSSGSRFNATYADLAERFESDTAYEPGTVVEMGGDKEITAVTEELSENVFGVVSSTAAYLMNAAAGDDSTHPPIAVGGRVHVKVIGKVKKGERLVASGLKGIARAAKKGEATAFNIIGRSLENKTTDGTGVVEAFVKIN